MSQGRLTKEDLDPRLVEEIESTSTRLEEVDERIEQHTNDLDNPHGVTAEQLGLGNVQNFGVATQEEAESGTSATKYMTPQRTKQAIDKNLITITQIVNDLEEQVVIKNPIVTWTILGMLNGWVNASTDYDKLSYRKDDLGNVNLRGLIKSGVVTPGTIIAILPNGFIPKKSVLAPCVSNDGTKDIFASIFINTLGEIRIGTAHNNWLSLDGISFNINEVA